MPHVCRCKQREFSFLGKHFVWHGSSYHLIAQYSRMQTANHSLATDKIIHKNSFKFRSLTSYCADSCVNHRLCNTTFSVAYESNLYRSNIRQSRERVRDMQTCRESIPWNCSNFHENSDTVDRVNRTTWQMRRQTRTFYNRRYLITLNGKSMLGLSRLYISETTCNTII